MFRFHKLLFHLIPLASLFQRNRDYDKERIIYIIFIFLLPFPRISSLHQVLYTIHSRKFQYYGQKKLVEIFLQKSDKLILNEHIMIKVLKRIYFNFLSIIDRLKKSATSTLEIKASKM